MTLKEIFEIYKLKKEIPSEQEIKEVFKDLQPEEVLKSLDLPKEKSNYIIPYRVKEGDIIEIFPSVDGLDMYFLVKDVYPEEDTVTLLLLSEFTEFAGPKDVKISLEGDEYIVQTDIFIDLPYESLATSLGRYIFKIGLVSDEELIKIDKVFHDEEKGDGKFTTPTKGLFKKEEAKRVAQLFYEYVQRMENYYKALNEIKWILEKEKVRLAASERERYTLLKENFYAKYDKESEVLIIKPEKELLFKMGKIILSLEDKEVILYDGVIYDQLILKFPKEIYNWQLLEKRLKLLLY